MTAARPPWVRAVVAKVFEEMEERMGSVVGSPPVESYWRLAKQWQREGKAPHGYWCPDLPCADLRAYPRRIALPVTVGASRFPTRSLVRRPREVSP